MGKSFVYLVTGPSGKQYVGITSISVAWRWKKHVYAAMSTAQGALQFAIRKHGANAFRIEQLCTCESRDEAREKEKHYIRELQTKAPRGYNLSAGGESGPPGFKQSAETKAKMSLVWASLSDEDRRARAQKSSAANARRTPEESAKISAAISASKIGKARPAEVNARISASRVGHKHTPETIAKMSASHAGATHTPEAIAKMSEIARSRSAETSEAMLKVWITRSRTVSDEARANMSAASQARREQTAEKMREIWRKRKEGVAA